MLGGGLFGKVVGECQSQFRKNRHYTAHTVAAAIDMQPAAAFAMAQKDSEMDLAFAFDCFRDIYGRFVEVQVADYTCGWAMQGMTAEEIKVQADKMRREKGATVRNTGSDGKAEFEAELMASLDGKVMDHPVKPPLSAIRKLMPYHEPGEYIIIGGRTGMGKSYLALNYIYNAAANGIPSSYINLENTPKNVQRRIWQMHSGMKWQPDMRSLSDDETRRAVRTWEEVKAMPLRSHNTGRNLQTIINTCRADYYERGTQVFIVDYVQLMKDGATRGNRVDVLAEISAELRALALELNVVMVAMAQINRTGTDAGDNRPQLTGLRGSGDLEQDATTVMLLYRPEYYQIQSDENNEPYPDGYADVHIAKGRETGAALARCRFDPVKGFYDAPAPDFSVMPDLTGAQPNYATFNNNRKEPDPDMPF